MPSSTDAQLEALIANPREDLHIELKAWLDLTDNAGKATLAKAIIALANHGGGFVLIGFDDPAGEAARPAAGRPVTLEAYSQDVINGIVQAYAAPPFHCSVYHVAHPTTGDRFPIVVVPGGHKVPIQAIKGSPDQRTLINGKYYIRRQGPQSAEPSTPEEWRELVMRSVRAGRDDLLDAIRDVLAGRVPEAAAPDTLAALKEWAEAGAERWRELIPRDTNGIAELPRGFYRVAYAIDGTFEKPSLAALRAILERSTIRHTGWPAWWVPTRAEIEPYAVDGLLECDVGIASGRLVSDPAHADFWRVSPDGRLLLLRGFVEDEPNRFQFFPGEVFSFTTPIWRTGDCLLHAASMAANLGAPEANVVFTMKWAGLRGRELRDVEGRRMLRHGYIARQDEIDLNITVPASSIDNNLPEIVLELLTPLYEVFSLFELPRFAVEEELRRLRQNQF